MLQSWRPPRTTLPSLAHIASISRLLRNTRYNSRMSIAANNASDMPDSTVSKSRRNLKLRFADVGINLGDPVFQGSYHGKQHHDSDLTDIIARAQDFGVEKMMITGSDLVESKHAIELARQYPGVCYATIGVHPCSVNSFDAHPSGPTGCIADLAKLAKEASGQGLAVAFGEFGLDYDRLYHAKMETQIKYFDLQLDLAVELQLPLFLHSRAAAEDFERLLTPRLENLPKRGLVHSFTGSMEEMESLVGLGFDIGVNGSSLKTEENLAVVKAIPLERLQLETDGPWCEIRPSHASHQYISEAPELPKAVKKEKWQKGLMVKGRNEPCTIIQVAHVVAKVREISVEEVCVAAWANSIRMFGLGMGNET